MPKRRNRAGALERPACVRSLDDRSRSAEGFHARRYRVERRDDDGAGRGQTAAHDRGGDQGRARAAAGNCGGRNSGSGVHQLPDGAGVLARRDPARGARGRGLLSSAQVGASSRCRRSRAGRISLRESDRSGNRRARAQCRAGRYDRAAVRGGRLQRDARILFQRRRPSDEAARRVGARALSAGAGYRRGASGRRLPGRVYSRYRKGVACPRRRPAARERGPRDFSRRGDQGDLRGYPPHLRAARDPLRRLHERR